MTGPGPDAQTEEKPAAPEQDLLLHPDDAELAELERLAAEEEASLKAEPEAEPEPAPAVPQQPQPMIPKARLDEVLRQGGELQQKLEELSRHNAYLAGQLEGLGKTPTAEPQAAAPNPVLEVKGRLFALGDRYDAGEMSMREFLEQRDALDTELAQAQAEAARPTPEQINGDPIVATATARMEADNPWFRSIPQFVIDRMLVGTAKDMLAERGIPVTQDARGTLVLRQAVIDVARMVGFDKQYGGAQQQQAPSAPQGVTAAERQAKIDLSQRLPPNPAKVGTSQQIDPMDPATLAEMSDSDLAALPASVLDRLTR